MRLPLSQPFRMLRAAWVTALALAALAMAGCNVAEGNPEEAPTVLHLALDDSLSRYDSVSVLIMDGLDTNRLVKTAWAGQPLIIPSQVPPCTLTEAKTNFLVKVRGYRSGGQLALETSIRYQDGVKRVDHRALPPLLPYNWLAQLGPSSGSLQPAYNPDILSYSLTLASGVATVAFDAVPAYSKAVVVVDGDTTKPGVPAKTFSVGAANFIVPITVADLGTARTYQIVVVPGQAFPVALEKMEMSEGAVMAPAFHPDTLAYAVTLAAATASVDFRFWPYDPVNQSLLYQGQSTIPGAVRKVNLSRGQTSVIDVTVSLNSITKTYFFTVNRL